MTNGKRVAVIGGGMAGLGAAWSLAQDGAEVTLIEANEDAGGRCRTFEWNGQWLIRGAAAFIGAEDNLVEQAEALGIHTPEAVADATQQHSWRIYHDGGQILEVADFGVKDILTASKIPAMEKIALGRVLPQILLQKAKNDDRDPTSAVDLDTVSACDYFREYSPTFVDYVLEPIMQMFCGYGKDDYSLAWLVWLMAGRFAWSSSWWTFAERGVGRLPHEIALALEAMSNVRILTSAKASHVSEDGSGVDVRYTKDGEENAERFDAAIVAVPGSLVSGMMPGLDDTRRAFFDSVEYVGHHIIYAILETEGVDAPTSLLLPTAEGFRTLSNFTLRPDPRGSFLYGEIKGARCAELRGASEAEVFEDALADLKRALPNLTIRSVMDSYIQRNDIALCRRHVGYTRALQAFQTLPPLSRIDFAGDYLLNSTVGQAHYTGLMSAKRLAARIGADNLAAVNV